jgi:long-chain fatty acid transport protein
MRRAFLKFFARKDRRALKREFAIDAAVALALALPLAVHATDGYFSNAYGVKAQGIAGVGIALPQDGLAAATNPAGTALVGDRIDLGVTWFVPKRGAEIHGNAFGADESFDGDGKKNFFIPEFGLTKQLSPTIGVGLAVYGNGGLNTQYEKNPFARFGATGTAGVDLAQLFVTPSFAYKLNEQNAIGVGVNFAYQRFKATGLDAFEPFSVSPGNFTDKGYDSSTGWGVRIGWTGQVTQQLTLGATWASKTRMGEFDKYHGLFADSGSFDIPANYGLGAAFKATPALTIAADVKRIEYSDVSAVGNPLSNLFAGNAFGSQNGPGFGWRDVTVFKIGASYDYSEQLTLRLGYSHGSQPIPDNQTLLNVLAPGVIQDHLSFGGTWKTVGGGELSLAYTHGFKKTVNGSGSIPPGFPPGGFGGGEANIHLQEDIFGLSYGWKL